MAENEVVFRDYNERVKRGFDALKDLADETGHQDLVKENDKALYFYCECSDENCRERIKLKPSHYTKIHRQRDQFIVKKGHEVDEIEDVVSDESPYQVVKKFVSIPKSASKLQKTAVDNS